MFLRGSSSLRHLVMIGVLWFAFVVLSLAAPVSAATYTVGCDSNLTARISALIAAFEAAVASTSNDTIELTAGCTYNLTALYSTLDGETGMPLVGAASTSGTLTVLGNGATIGRAAGAPVMRFLYTSIGADLTVSDVTFRGGSATLGGAIYNGFGAGFSADRVSFIDNQASVNGGAIYSSGGTTIDNSLFSGNSAQSRGGAIGVGHGMVTVNTSVFQNNRSTSFGGAIDVNYGHAIVESSTFSGNRSTYGGAINIDDDVDNYSEVRNSTFNGNSVTGNGGAIRNTGLLTVAESTFNANQASSGAGITNGGGGTIIIERSTIVGNSASTLAGGVLRDGVSTTYIGGSLIAGNSAPTHPDISGAITSLGYNIVTAISGSGYGASDRVGVGLASLNLGTLADNGGLTRTIALQEGSIAINTGDPSFSPPLTYDQRGPDFLRVRRGRIDVGAFEAGCPAPAFTIANGDVAALRNAIICANESSENDTITLAAGGTYSFTNGYEDFNGLNALPLIGPPIFTGDLTINGNGATLTRADSSPEMRFLYIYNLPNATVTLNRLTLNSGRLSGSNNGGAIYVNGNVVINDSTITNNRATYGGAIYITSFQTTITRSLFSGNAGLIGGAVYKDRGNLTATNNTFTGNGSATNGGAINVVPSAPYVTLLAHNTLVSNAAGFSGGAISVQDTGETYTGNVQLSHNLFASNTATNGAHVYRTITSQGYNIVPFTGDSSGWAATDIVNGAATPLNLGPLADNGGFTQTFALLTGSIAINTGNPAFAPPPTTDQRGFARVQNGRIDIGAFEVFSPASLTVQLTLQGRPTAPNATHVITAHVQVRPTVGAPLLSADYLSSTDGRITLNNLPPGSYTLWVKGTHTLAGVQSVTLVAGANSVTTAALREGDANDDNVVTIADFSLLAAAFGKATGQAGFDARADFNQDGAVNVSDFSLLAASFGQSGAG